MNEAEAITTIRQHQPANLVYPEQVRAKKRARRRMVAIGLLGARCLDCGLREREHPEVYEFDHVRGTKYTEMSRLWGRSWTVISRELKKCDLVCRNCHVKRTAHRRKENGCE